MLSIFMKFQELQKAKDSAVAEEIKCLTCSKPSTQGPLLPKKEKRQGRKPKQAYNKLREQHYQFKSSTPTERSRQSTSVKEDIEDKQKKTSV